jgi:hypothetical protein
VKSMIDPRRNSPGDHAESVAMRGLSQHYSGLALPEEPVFGLGAGPPAVYLSETGIDPIPPCL